jgi:hypothetical protein
LKRQPAFPAHQKSPISGSLNCWQYRINRS